MMLYMGRLAREGASELARATPAQKNEALERMAARLAAGSEKIVEANRQDLEAAQKKGRDAAFLDRLKLDALRVAAMARGLREIAALARSGRPGDRILDTAERSRDRARARAARRNRHDL